MRANEQIDCNFFLFLWHCRYTFWVECFVLSHMRLENCWKNRAELHVNSQWIILLPLHWNVSESWACATNRHSWMKSVFGEILRSTQMHGYRKKTNKCVNSPTWTSHSLSETEHCAKWVNDGKTKTESDFYTVDFSRERLRLSALSTRIMKLWPWAKWFSICKIYQPHTDIPNELVGFRWFFVWKIVSEKFVQTFNKLICL